ncbi:hypothetical protein ACWEGE_11375 [Amycolatopsis sp. NPDC004747]
MHARDRELLAALTKVNSKIGSVTVELLTLKADTVGLHILGCQLVHIGVALTRRAGTKPDDFPAHQPRHRNPRPNGAV